MGRIVGIDLGTTNSLVAYTDTQTGAPKCIPGPYGSTLCPSVVSVDTDWQHHRGRSGAPAFADTTGACCIYSVKRLMESRPCGRARRIEAVSV